MLALTVALLLGSAQTAAPAEPTREAEAVIDRMHSAASAADGATYFAQFTPDARFIGTDASERWTLDQFRAYATPYFDKGQGWTYAPRERSIALTADRCSCVAWFDERLDSAAYGEARGSGVVVRTAEGWKIAQYVLSFPIPNAIADEVTDRIRAQAATAP